MVCIDILNPKEERVERIERIERIEVLNIEIKFGEKTKRKKKISFRSISKKCSVRSTVPGVQ